ncbi:MAG: GPW/gp25 family protein [Geobacteraceae bacterium]|nr:GPW/gp25 family protein [Geobacteraceae bacterium]
MTVRVNDITAIDWSPRLGSPGEVVTGLDDIDQCIAIIINTRKGSVPHNPLKGCDAWRWIDAPANIAVPNIIRESVDALELWEPRIKVTGVTTEITGAGSATITVSWQPLNSQLVRITEVNLVNPS